MHFEPVPEPKAFDCEVRQPGLRWLETHPDASRPRPYWTRFKPALAEGFRNLCGYSAMFEPVSTVDHFISWRNDASLTYEWSNLRFASQWINSSKQTIDEQVLDPYEVEDGWFEITLPSLQLVLTENIPDKFRKRAEFTLIRLRLRDDERVIKQRRVWYRLYREGKLPLEGLREMAPLIARAVEKPESGQHAR